MRLLTLFTFLSVASTAPAADWAIALHGGAGRIPKDIPTERVERYEKSLAAALQVGTKILEEGGSSLDAVEAVVRAMEDEPMFNAGRGAVFTAAGGHELDASIMDGSTKACGAVASVTSIEHPITAARRVMERTPHVLLAGAGAEAFAAEVGCRTVENSHFFTPRRWASFRRLVREAPAKPSYGLPNEGSVEASDEEEAGGTVGCVALDSYGNLAAATSTGGLTGKMSGRVGDTPIIGAGTYADGRVAVSGTGKGEQYIRHQIAARVAWLAAGDDTNLDAAVRKCLDEVLDPGDGGLIALDKDGQMSLRTSTGAMPRAWASRGESPRTAIWE